MKKAGYPASPFLKTGSGHSFTNKLDIFYRVRRRMSNVFRIFITLHKKNHTKLAELSAKPNCKKTFGKFVFWWWNPEDAFVFSFAFADFYITRWPE